MNYLLHDFFIWFGIFTFSEIKFSVQWFEGNGKTTVA